jgi:hypothetical protein
MLGFSEAEALRIDFTRIRDIECLNYLKASTILVPHAAQDGAMLGVELEFVAQVPMRRQLLPRPRTRSHHLALRADANIRRLEAKRSD